MAAANPNITADAIEATEFMDLSRKYRVTGVPKTIVNETIEILGGLPEQVLDGRTGRVVPPGDQIGLEVPVDAPRPPGRRRPARSVRSRCSARSRRG